MPKLPVLSGAVLLLALGACANQTQTLVHEEPPLYCDHTLAGVECHDTPDDRHWRQLVNYQGPTPEFRDPPPVRPLIASPPAVNFYVRDPEPIPRL